MITGQFGVYTLLSNLLTSISDALGSTPGGTPGFASIFPGEISWDECCVGMLGITASEHYITSEFPHTSNIQNPVDLTTCRAAWYIVNVTIDLLRCAPQPQGNNPEVTPQQLTLSAREVNADAWVLIDTLSCYLQSQKDSYEIIDYSIERLSVVGPDGGCIGSEVLFAVALYRGEDA
jgi:hypothetical protein